MTAVSVAIAQHISSGKDITALIDTLNEDDSSLSDATSASASIIAAADSFTAFIAKTPTLQAIANTSIGLSFVANVMKAREEITAAEGPRAITNATLLALGSNMADIATYNHEVDFDTHFSHGNTEQETSEEVAADVQSGNVYNTGNASVNSSTANEGGTWSIVNVSITEGYPLRWAA